MNKYLVTLLVIISMVFIAPALLSLGIRHLPAFLQAPLHETFEIHGPIKISQKFICQKNNLSAIGLSFKNPFLENKESIEMLVQGSNGQIIRRAYQSGKYIGDGVFVKFSFEPIQNCLGQTLTFSLSSPDSSIDKGLMVFLTDITDQNSPATLISGKKINDQNERSMAYVPFYQPESSLSLMGAIYRGWIGRFFNDSIFATLYLGLVFTLSGLVYYGYKKSN